MICAYFPEKKPFPWSLTSSGAVVSMAMPTEDRLLLLTTQAQLYSLPFASAVAGASTFAATKPMGLKAHHGTTLAMAFDPRSNVLAILGEGSKSKALPGLSFTLWSAQGQSQLKLLSSLGMPATIKKPGAAPHNNWSVTFSPTSEYIAIAAQPQG